MVSRSGQEIREGSREKYSRRFSVEGFYHAWKAPRLPNGNLIVTAGYGAFVIELDPVGRIVRQFGGKDQVSENARPFFYVMFQSLPHGNFVLASRQGHAPGVRPFQRAIVGIQNRRGTRLDVEQRVLVLDGLNTTRLHDERSGIMQPLES